MNLHNIKRGFSRTNPENGLRTLVGAQKSDRPHSAHPSIRLSGTYISEKHEKSGRALGLISWGLAWVSVGLLVCSLILSYFPPEAEDSDLRNTMLTAYVIVGFILHTLAMVADGVTNSNAPLARKSIILFWGSIGLVFALLIPISMLVSLLV